MFDHSSYQDTLRDHDRSHHPIAGGMVLVAAVAFAIGFCIFLI